MNAPLTWLDLSKVKDGTRIVFTTSWDIYPECVVPEGTTGTVVENGLNEIWSCLMIKTDDALITEAPARVGRSRLFPPDQ